MSDKAMLDAALKLCDEYKAERNALQSRLAEAEKEASKHLNDIQNALADGFSLREAKIYAEVQRQKARVKELEAREKTYRTALELAREYCESEPETEYDGRLEKGCCFNDSHKPTRKENGVEVEEKCPWVEVNAVIKSALAGGK